MAFLMKVTRRISEIAMKRKILLAAKTIHSRSLGRSSGERLREFLHVRDLVLVRSPREREMALEIRPNLGDETILQIRIHVDGGAVAGIIDNRRKVSIFDGIRRGMRVVPARDVEPEAEMIATNYVVATRIEIVSNAMRIALKDVIITSLANTLAVRSIPSDCRYQTTISWIVCASRRNKKMTPTTQLVKE